MPLKMANDKAPIAEPVKTLAKDTTAIEKAQRDLLAKLDKLASSDNPTKADLDAVKSSLRDTKLPKSAQDAIEKLDPATLKQVAILSSTKADPKLKEEAKEALLVKSIGDAKDQTMARAAAIVSVAIDTTKKDVQRQELAKPATPEARAKEISQEKTIVKAMDDIAKSKTVTEDTKKSLADKLEKVSPDAAKELSKVSPKDLKSAAVLQSDSSTEAMKQKAAQELVGRATTGSTAERTSATTALGVAQVSLTLRQDIKDSVKSVTTNINTLKEASETNSPKAFEQARATINKQLANAGQVDAAKVVATDLKQGALKQATAILDPGTDKDVKARVVQTLKAQAENKTGAISSEEQKSAQAAVALVKAQKGMEHTFDTPANGKAPAKAVTESTVKRVAKKDPDEFGASFAEHSANTRTPGLAAYRGGVKGSGGKFQKGPVDERATAMAITDVMSFQGTRTKDDLEEKVNAIIVYLDKLKQVMPQGLGL